MDGISSGLLLREEVRFTVAFSLDPSTPRNFASETGCAASLR